MTNKSDICWKSNNLTIVMVDEDVYRVNGKRICIPEFADYFSRHYKMIEQCPVQVREGILYGLICAFVPPISYSPLEGLRFADGHGEGIVRAFDIVPEDKREFICTQIEKTSLHSQTLAKTQKLNCAKKYSQHTKAGEIVFSTIGLCVMYLGDGKYLCEEQIYAIPKFLDTCDKLKTVEREIPAPILMGIIWAGAASLDLATLQKVELDHWSARGYAYGLTLLSQELRMSAFANLQLTPHNLFKVHPITEKFFVACATEKEKGEFLVQEQAKLIQDQLPGWLDEWEKLH